MGRSVPGPRSPRAGGATPASGAAYLTHADADREQGGLEAHEIWSAIVLGHVTRCLLSVGRFRQRKWQDIRVEIEPVSKLEEVRLLR